MAPGSEAAWLCTAGFPVSRDITSPSGFGEEQTCAPLAGRSVRVPLQKDTRDGGSVVAVFGKDSPAWSCLSCPALVLLRSLQGGCLLFLAPASSEVSGGAYCLLNGIQCAPKLFMETDDIFSGK